ncbi:MAG: NAD(P)/FAD-dependent oxidoreductase [Hydrogenophaga sp.]|uniref:flavin-containing monooxygenase n=1 Tax=Hydrogenophaga sp. TaxID=1904254 RepID=UPI0027255CC6|nr:NAD(P)/FAD-dependent oxidoreductase [Hydrogenophaga sp.]MDO9253288.1 NAD(P)/FAD-dependent oxidoreductase [Hydrogenophaga sp.]MDP2407670.1 NAD(P)/FAD-dependent oxidoreductase [Hydrogenophaga sp.]MDZ4174017.1 NAD(P)/FAD-dependent oxidoreductase [Hydrogenophaga sp.]
MTQNPQRTPSVLVIGAGATGMLAVIRLREAGITNVTVIEKADRVGGTWRDNTYPGVACDIPSHHYCYSFEPAPWKAQCATGAELKDYLEHVAKKYRVIERVRFGRTVTSCLWDDAGGRWTVDTDKGDHFVVDFVIAATGILHHPKMPDIPGLDSFAGPAWHTARWRHDVDLQGQRIGVIGTGSTSHQVVPELVNAGHQVHVFQRTPQWVFPFPNLPFPEWLRRRWIAKPERMRPWKTFYKAFIEQFFVKATVGHPVQNALLNVTVKSYLRLAVRNRDLRQKLTPDYRVGCKRMVVNFTFYPAIQKPNAHLETEAIERIEPEGVRLKTGRLVPLDALVLSTGFHNFNYVRPMTLVGRNGHRLEDSWGQGRYTSAHAVLMAHFPNFFLMLGPGTPIGNNSVIGMAEEQLDYVVRLIGIWRRGEADEIEPTPQAVSAFTRYIKAGLGKSVWTGGCQSWYLDADGVPVVFPYPWQDFVRSMKEINTHELTMVRRPRLENAHAL